jgi:hypothetical protein
VNEKRYKIKNEETSSFEDRLDKVINTALETAEKMLGIKSEGDFFSRLYRVRQICWDKIYLPDTDNLECMPKLKRSVMDLGAGEAWYIARHQELADFAWYFKHELPSDSTDLHQKVEYIQNLWDFANRSMGGALANRVNIFPRKVIIKTAPPVNISSRLDKYKEDKRNTINTLVTELEKAYIDCIKEVNEEYL